jgi:hypothetical protein
LLTRDVKNARRSLLVSAQELETFDRRWASAADLYALSRTHLLVLTRKPDEEFKKWAARASVCIERGADGIRGMLLESLGTNVLVQQKIAFERLVDFLECNLRPLPLSWRKSPADGERRLDRLGASQAMTHSWLTVPILPPEVEKALERGEGIRLFGGVVKDFFNYPHSIRRDEVLPEVEFALQPGMGMGARAGQDMAVGTIFGFYVGENVQAPVVGENYIAHAHPSRYQVTIQGNIKLLKQRGINKAACDGQMTASRNFAWVLANNVVGPYLNAAWKVSDAEDESSLESDTGPSDDVTGHDEAEADNANSVLDRTGAWIDPETKLLCMAMVCSKPVFKGQFLMWKYNPRAGAGRFWSFG